MAFKRALPTPTTEQVTRWQVMQAIGCLCARLRGLGFVPGEIHHITVNGRTVSHSHTLCLSPWSHRGVPQFGRSRADMESIFGPSLSHGSKPFHEAFGSDDELIAAQDQLVAKYRRMAGC